MKKPQYSRMTNHTKQNSMTITRQILTDKFSQFNRQLTRQTLTEQIFCFMVIEQFEWTLRSWTSRSSLNRSWTQRSLSHPRRRRAAVHLVLHVGGKRAPAIIMLLAGSLRRNHMVRNTRTIHVISQFICWNSCVMIQTGPVVLSFLFRGVAVLDRCNRSWVCYICEKYSQI